MKSTIPSVPETLAAVEVLTRAGVSDELVGRAVREWLTHLQTTQTLGLELPQGLSGPLHNQSPVPATGPVPASHAFTGVVPSRAEPRFVPIKIRYPDGTVTNIALTNAVFQGVAQQCGGAQAARDLARKLALDAPLGVGNRSKWVTEELLKRVPPSLDKSLGHASL